MIISLGENCFSSWIATKLRWKKSKDEGYLTCPFDVTYTPYEDICKMIKNEFEESEICEYIIDPDGVYRHKKTNMRFVHDKGLTKRKLNEKMKQRIENFEKGIQKCIESKTKCNFIHTIDSMNEHKCKELQNAIEERYDGLKYKILTIKIEDGEEVEMKEKKHEGNMIQIRLSIPNWIILWEMEDKHKSEYEKLLKIFENELGNNW